ncbi:DUF5134 domain-containing protein [Microbacterium sp. RU33B]|uniref:DUF5134 domain-containing protein n=1 Tax=Microbacterium sp. RU33B TaxID=1907390 RepID=UPI00095C9D64|nr:DUF5134 domain-containing protein [Microbacterium sp. RU33B]SIT72274.1 protein of unknown function [Microbacterium sp. RU33B]
MLTSPWDLILTALFAATGIWCAIDLIAHRPHARSSDGTLTQHTLIDVNHLVMSAAMIVMIWTSVIDAATWAQVIVFAIFALALVPGLLAKTATRERVSLAAHVGLNAAMIWMLAAMPLLMAGMEMGHDGSSGHHHGGGSEMMATATPAWADVVNLLFVALSAAAAVWWLVALFGRRRRLHDLCYAAMAAGMALMLLVMNA